MWCRVATRSYYYRWLYPPVTEEHGRAAHLTHSYIYTRIDSAWLVTLAICLSIQTILLIMRSIIIRCESGEWWTVWHVKHQSRGCPSWSKRDCLKINGGVCRVLLNSFAPRPPPVLWHGVICMKRWPRVSLFFLFVRNLRIGERDESMYLPLPVQRKSPPGLLLSFHPLHLHGQGWKKHAEIWVISSV